MNLGPRINSDAEEGHPSITLDGRYFFFTSNRVTNVHLPPGIPPAGSMPGGGSRDIYWMKADFIENLRTSPPESSRGPSPSHVAAEPRGCALPAPARCRGSESFPRVDPFERTFQSFGPVVWNLEFRTRMANVEGRNRSASLGRQRKPSLPSRVRW